MAAVAYTHLDVYKRHTLDVSLNDLRMQVRFFEDALGAAEDIANKIKQNTDEYIDTILPPLTKALFKYVREGKYTFCTPGHMGGTAFQKSPVAVSYTHLGVSASGKARPAGISPPRFWQLALPSP